MSEWLSKILSEIVLIVLKRIEHALPLASKKQRRAVYNKLSVVFFLFSFFRMWRIRSETEIDAHSSAHSCANTYMHVCTQKYMLLYLETDLTKNTT